MLDLRRRQFITLLGSAAAAWPLAARAQQSAMPVIGYLGLHSPSGDVERISSFRKGLKEAGFDEGRNVSIEFRFAEGDVSRLPTFVAEFVSRKVTVMFAPSAAAALAAKTATSTVPIVFATGADPIQSGLVARLNRPGGNLTGVSFFSPQMESKRLGLLHELVPKTDLIAVLLNPNNPFFENQLKDVNEASRALGVKIHIETASNERDITAALQRIRATACRGSACRW